MELVVRRKVGITEYELTLLALSRACCCESLVLVVMGHLEKEKDIGSLKDSKKEEEVIKVAMIHVVTEPIGAVSSSEVVHKLQDERAHIVADTCATPENSPR